mgnify:FL=1
MKTFTFDQLDERAKATAMDKHEKDAYILNARANDYYLSLDSSLYSSGWRFTEHGERIA